MWTCRGRFNLRFCGVCIRVVVYWHCGCCGFKKCLSISVVPVVSAAMFRKPTPGFVVILMVKFISRVFFYIVCWGVPWMFGYGLEVMKCLCGVLRECMFNVLIRFFVYMCVYCYKEEGPCLQRGSQLSLVHWPHIPEPPLIASVWQTLALSSHTLTILLILFSISSIAEGFSDCLVDC